MKLIPFFLSKISLPVLADAKKITNPALDPSIGTGGTDPTIFSSFISTGIQLMFLIGVVVAVFFFIIAVYEWITSGGDKARIQESQHRLRDVLVGLFLLFSVYAIMNLIGYIFKIDLLKLKVPKISDLI